MPLDSKPLESIEESDLQALGDNKEPESKTIEYKESLFGKTDSDKKEFLADVSSFANASGGDLIFGIKADTGVPVDVCGLQGIDADAEILRIESIIRDGIRPRIYVSTRAVPLQGNRVAIVVRIPRSWAMPHMVTYNRDFRFYSRSSNGKYPLDVDELRAAFLLSETAAERIRSFRMERLGKVVAGETPVALREGGKIVLHIVPLNAFHPAVRYDVTSLVRIMDRLQPLNTTGWNHRHNFDGFLTYAAFSQDGSSHTYLQIFRNGIIEAVTALRLLSAERSIPSLTYEQELLHGLPRFLSIQKHLGVEMPLFIMLTLLEVRGYTMGVSSRFGLAKEDIHYIDKDALLVAEVMIETFDCDPAEVMKPILDSIWNAAGWPRSMNYDENGRWVGR